LQPGEGKLELVGREAATVRKRSSNREEMKKSTGIKGSCNSEEGKLQLGRREAAIVTIVRKGSCNREEGMLQPVGRKADREESCVEGKRKPEEREAATRRKGSCNREEGKLQPVGREAATR
jgi:hypothetical protein